LSVPAAVGRALERAAGTEVPVLILGAPGTGRSGLARELHRRSGRAGGPLIEVDPSTIPATLFESEFFGHRRGAFTGADRDVAGRVARAAGGTLVLDHVEDLPLPAQSKLLRLAAEHVYSPLGGEETGADVRLVAIGADDLPVRAARGLFRSDLFFRLEVVTLVLPPLQARRAEIGALAQALLLDLASRMGVAAPELSAAALDWLPEHSWPGNLRELRNVLERALLLHREGPLVLARPLGAAGPRPRSLVELEAEEIAKALAYTRGRQGQAAALLGISRKTLWEKRKRHGIP
jgi:DNA-binding NtrC family response regulator